MRWETITPTKRSGWYAYPSGKTAPTYPASRHRRSLSSLGRDLLNGGLQTFLRQRRQAVRARIIVESAQEAGSAAGVEIARRACFLRSEIGYDRDINIRMMRMRIDAPSVMITTNPVTMITTAPNPRDPYHRGAPVIISL